MWHAAQNTCLHVHTTSKSAVTRIFCRQMLHSGMRPLTSMSRALAVASACRIAAIVREKYALVARVYFLLAKTPPISLN